MSVRQSNQINFSISYEKQTFKLVELPSELLTCLDLSVTSTPTTTDTLQTAQGPALLVHGSRKYQMRSKNSSNTILLFQPPSVDFNFIDSPEVNSVVAVSQCDETIELLLVDEEPKFDTKKVNKWHEKFAKSRPTKKN